MRALRAHSLDVWLGGKSLRAADGRIWIKNIKQEIRNKSTYGESTGLDGRRRKRVRREVIRLTVEFGILELREVEAREAAIESANAWAGDGYLERSDKPGRRVYVNCQERASIQDVFDPKETFSIVFETAESPYWEDTREKGLALTGLTGTQEVTVPGTLEARAECHITPGSGTLNALSLTFGDTAMAFAGLNVAAGNTLHIEHGENGYLRIYSGADSKYGCRLGESDDELEGGPGKITAAFTANTDCTVEFRIRGRYR